MNSKPKTLVINTMTEGKYLDLLSKGKISDKQINIVDNDDAGRTVIASYDIVNEKVKDNRLSLSYDKIDGAKYIRLVDKDRNEQSRIPAAEFIKDGMLNGIEYRATNDDGGALWFTVSADGYSPTELSVMLVDSELLSASTNAVQNKAVYSIYSDVKNLQEQILGFKDQLNILDENISAVINTAGDLQEKIDAGSKEVNDTVKVVNSDGIVIYYRVTEKDGVKEWEEYNRENAAFVPTKNIDIAGAPLLASRLLGAPDVENTKGLSELDTHVPSSKLVKNLLSSINTRLNDIENDYVKYTAVPTQDLPERKAVILKNGDLITGKTHDGSSDRHLIGIAGTDRDIINVGANGIQLNLNTASYDCGPLGTLNAINVNGGSDFMMTNGAMPMAVTGDGSTVDVQTREIAVLPGVNVKQLVISTDAESKANSYTDSEISKLSAEVSTVYQTKIDSQTSATALDIRLTNIENDYLVSADKTELQGKIDEKADSTTLVQVSSDLSAYADSVGENAIQSAGEYTNSVSGEIRTDLNDLSGTVVTIYSDYALSSDVSSKAELEEEFKKYQLSGNYLSVETFENTISDYALSSDVSSKTELAEEFKKYQLSGNYLSIEVFENTIKLSVENLSGDIAAKTISITGETTSEGYLKSYTISQGGTEIGVIDIPKDFLVKSGKVKTCDEDDKPMEGYRVGDKYLDFIVNVAEGISAEDQHIYINVKDLTDVYSGTNGAEILVIVDSSNQISAVIQAGAINKEKIADAVYNDISCIASSYIENGINSLDIDEINGDASKTISKITESNGLVGAQFVQISIDMDQVSGLADKFDTYALSSNVYNKTELDEEFKKYLLSGNYLSAEVFENTISNYALSSDVSSKTELNGKFKTVDASILGKLDRICVGCTGLNTAVAIGNATSALGGYSLAKGKGNIAFSDYSSAEGDGECYAGALGFKVDSKDTSTMQLTLETTEGPYGKLSDMAPGTWMMIFKRAKTDTNISATFKTKFLGMGDGANKISVNYIPNITIGSNTYVIFPETPWFGKYKLGDGAHVEGYANIAMEDAGAYGVNNFSVGRYSHTIGNANKANYMATAIGSGNAAFGSGSIAMGGSGQAAASTLETNSIVSAANAFAWSGNGKYEIPVGKRDKTFNINPAGGANGFYIGHRTLPSIVREIVDGHGTGDDSARIIKIDIDGETFTANTTAEQFVNAYIDPNKIVYNDDEEGETTIPKTPDEIKEEAEHLYAMTTEGDDKYNYYGIEVTQSGTPAVNSYSWKRVTEKTGVAYIKKDGDSDIGPLMLSGDLSVNAAQNIKIGENDLCSVIEDVKKATIECMWNAISAYTVYDGQLKSENQLSVDDIIYSFRDMAANLSSMWAQLNA